MMVISQFAKIIRIDTKSVRAAGRSTSGVRVSRPRHRLHGSQRDGNPPEDPKINGGHGMILQ
jgi:DNA gyrase subunit A